MPAEILCEKNMRAVWPSYVSVSQWAASARHNKPCWVLPPNEFKRAISEPESPTRPSRAVLWYGREHTPDIYTVSEEKCATDFSP